MTSESLKRVANYLNNINFIAIVFHKNPDGDALGSALALKEVLVKLNKYCKILFNEKIDERFEFLFKNYVCENFEPKHYIAVDLASENLLEEPFKNIKFDLVIDHHKNNSLKCEIKLVDEHAASTCELIYLLIKQLNVKINKQMALFLYVGVVSDTGCFKFPNTTSTTHKIAAELITFNFDFAKVNFNLFEKKTISQFKLQNLVFEQIKFDKTGRCAVALATSAMFNLSGASLTDFFIVIDLVKSLAEIAVAIKQVDDSFFKVSVRTISKYSAFKFCEKFGGGGHELAAGFELKGNVNLIQNKILSDLEDFF